MKPANTRKLYVRPVELKEANALIAKWHRHHKPVVGHRFSIGCFDQETNRAVGVCVVGRPVARNTDQRLIVEVNRLASDGTPNVCSMLYQAAANAAKAMGYAGILTTILKTENGATLKGAGWQFSHDIAPGCWSVSSRPRPNVVNQPWNNVPKHCWFRWLNPRHHKDPEF